MTDEKNTPADSPAPPPPTIAPKKPVPRPPGPPPAGKSISTEHFVLPEVDLESMSDLPNFSDITSSSVDQAPAPGAVRHGGGRIATDHDAADVDPDDSDAQDAAEHSADEHDGPTIGAKVKGWAGSALDSVKSLGPKPKDDADAGAQEATDADTPVNQSSTQVFSDGVGTSTPAAEAPTQVPPVAAAPATEAPRQAAGGPRKVRLAVARLDPWSVMKLSFLMSVATGIMLVVATWVFWYALNDLGVFTSIDELISGIVGQESTDFDFLQYLARDKVMSVATLIAVVDVVLLTALATIGAFLYNIVAALVGGIHLTMTDD